jgi:hypothetical protein
MSLYYLRPVLDEIDLPIFNRFKYLSLPLRPNERFSAEVVDLLPSGKAILRIKGSDVEIKTQIPLKKDMQLELQVMPLKNGEKDIKLRIVSAMIPQQKEIPNILDKIPTTSTLLQLATGDKEYTKTVVIKNFQSVEQKFLSQANQILDQLSKVTTPSQREAVLSRAKELLEPFFLEPSNKDFILQLKNLVENSGLGFSSKLYAIAKRSEELVAKLHSDKSQGFELLKEFLKDVSKAPLELRESLNELNKEIQEIKKEALFIQKQESIIDYARLMSFLSQGVFVPFFWEFGDGNMVIKSLGKKGYLCKIYLDFEDIGGVEVDIFAHQKDLLVDFYSGHNLFLELVKEGLEGIKKELPFEYIFFRFHKQKKQKREFVEDAFKNSLVDVKI